MALNNLNASCLGHINNGLSGNAIQKAVWSGSMQSAISHQKKNIRACRLGNIASPIKHQRILKTLLFSYMFG